MGKTTRQKLAIDESRILLVTQNNRFVSVSSKYVNNIIQYFKVRDGETKDLRNITGLEREKFRRDHIQRGTNKYLYSTTKICSTIIMAMGNQKVAYLIKTRSAYGDFIVFGRWYHETRSAHGDFIVFGRWYHETRSAHGDFIVFGRWYHETRSAYGDFIVFGRWYHENTTKIFLKHFVIDRAIFEKGPYFPKIMLIYEIKGNTNILSQDVKKRLIFT